MTKETLQSGEVQAVQNTACVNGILDELRVDTVNEVLVALASGLNWVEIVGSCVSPKDFMKLFKELGIPDDKWKSSWWLQKRVMLPKEDGSTGTTVALYQAIIKRFKGYRIFVAWMEGKNEPEKTWFEKVEECKTPEDFLIMFRDLGISGANWKRNTWFIKMSKLPEDEGGIDRSLASLAMAITKRFKSHRNFVLWMHGINPEKSWRERVDECHSPEDFLSLFGQLGIPGDKWRSSAWLQKNAKFSKDEGGVGRPLKGLYVAIKKKFGRYVEFVDWMKSSEAVLRLISDLESEKEDDVAWSERIASCETPEDFLRLFAEIGIPEGKWKDNRWFNRNAKYPKNGSGGKIFLQEIYKSIKGRFNSHGHFVTWMEGEKKSADTWREKVDECESREDFLNLFAQVGISGDEWKRSVWLERTAGLSKEEGGIGVSMQTLCKLIRKRFGGYPQFVAWMEGGGNLKKTWVQKVDECESREDFLRLFESAGIPGDKWKNSAWLQNRAKLSKENGGIGKSLAGLYEALRKKYKNYPEFVGWMEGRGDVVLSWRLRVEQCVMRADFLNLFRECGVSDGRWRSGAWLCKKAILSRREGGVGMSMNGFYTVTKKRFGGFPKFVAWMDGKEKPEDSWPQKVDMCKEPKDFIELFKKSGIPGEEWKNSNWLGRTAVLSVEEGGVGRSYAGLYASIRIRFKGYDKFMVWMGVKEIAGTWTDIVDACETPAEFLDMLRQIGVSADEWRNVSWFRTGAKLAKEQGGVGRSLSGLFAAILQRFGGQQSFVAWMDGNPIPQINSVEEAVAIIRAEAERLGVQPEELLTPDKISEYVRSNPVLKMALNYFA